MKEKKNTKMGNVRDKEVADANTCMTQRECHLLHDTWHGFCSANHEGGVLIFSAFLSENPHLVTLFHRFRVMPLSMLSSDPAFRAHACTVAYHVTSMVDNADDPVLLEALIRKNAVLHTTKAGVYPHHFEALGRVLMNIMLSRDDKKQITPAAITAWRKLLEFLLRITNDVYTKAGIKFVKPGLKASSSSDPSSEDSMSAFETCFSGMSNKSEVTGEEMMNTPPSNICSPGTSASPKTRAGKTHPPATCRTGSEKRLKGRAKSSKDGPRPKPAPSESQIPLSQSTAANTTKPQEESNNPPASDKQIGRPASSSTREESSACSLYIKKDSNTISGSAADSRAKETDATQEISKALESSTLREFQELGLLASGPAKCNGQTVDNTSQGLFAGTTDHATYLQNVSPAKIDPPPPSSSSESAVASKSEIAKPGVAGVTGRVNSDSRTVPASAEGQKKQQPSPAGN